jgi:hypothetical protein
MRYLSYQLSHLWVWSHGFNEQNLGRIQVHAIRLVQFLASFDEHVVDLLGFSWLGFWIGLNRDYGWLAPPEPEVLRIIAEESVAKGTD